MARNIPLTTIIIRIKPCYPKQKLSESVPYLFFKSIYDSFGKRIFQNGVSIYINSILPGYKKGIKILGDVKQGLWNILLIVNNQSLKAIRAKKYSSGQSRYVRLD